MYQSTKIVMLGKLFSNMFFPILGAAFLDKSKGVRLKIALNRATPNPMILSHGFTHPNHILFDKQKNMCTSQLLGTES